MMSEVRLLVESSASCTYTHYFECENAGGQYQGMFDYAGGYQSLGENSANCAGKMR